MSNDLKFPVDQMVKTTVKHNREVTDMQGKPLALTKGQEVQAFRSHVNDYEMFGIRTETGIIILPSSDYKQDFKKFIQDI